MGGKTAILGCVVLSALGCAHRGATPSTDTIEKKLALDVQVVTLANGLKVVIQEDHRAPVVAVNVTYHVGAADDPAGRGGFAHLFEHLMFSAGSCTSTCASTTRSRTASTRR